MRRAASWLALGLALGVPVAAWEPVNRRAAWGLLRAGSDGAGAKVGGGPDDDYVPPTAPRGLPDFPETNDEFVVVDRAAAKKLPPAPVDAEAPKKESTEPLEKANAALDGANEALNKASAALEDAEAAPAPSEGSGGAKDPVAEATPEPAAESAPKPASKPAVVDDAPKVGPPPVNYDAYKDPGAPELPEVAAAKTAALESATSLAERLTSALAEKVQNLVVPMLHFGDELKARLNAAVAQLDESLNDLNAAAGSHQTRERLVERCATAAVEPMLDHISTLQAQYRSRFEDRFASIMAGAADFEDRATALLKDSLEGMRTACRAALPAKYADVPIDARVATRIGLPATATLRSVTEGFIKELEGELIDIVEERRENGDVVADILDEAEKDAGQARVRRRVKYVIAQSVALALNYFQFWYNKHAAMQENRRREDHWPRLPIF